jgi:hypothetical protein
VAEQGGDGLEPHAAVDGLSGQSVAEPVRVDARDAGGTSDAADDPPDEVPVQRAAVVGDQPLAGSDVVEVRGGPGAEQPDEVGVQGHVPVVAELAERDPQPVPGADLHDRVRSPPSARSAARACSPAAVPASNPSPAAWKPGAGPQPELAR